MARNSDYGLMIWDCKSTGTLSNIVELLREGKKSVVFVNKSRDFVAVPDKSGLDNLLTFMSTHARAKAEEKMGLSSKMAEFVQERLSLNVSGNGYSSSMHETRPDIAESAEAAPAHSESTRLRSALMSALKDHISRAQLSQSQAAKIFGVTQPRVSDLTRGKVDLFGLDALVNMAAMAGLRVEMHIREAK